MDLSRSNSKKETLIYANILISISLITLYLLHSILISKPKKKYRFLSLFSVDLPPPRLGHQKKKKKEKKRKKEEATAVGYTTEIFDTREYHMLMRYLSYHLVLLGP